MAEELLISEFMYDLPNDRIAKFPVKPRDHARLLQWKNGSIDHHHFFDLPEILPKNALLVVNRSRVIAARLILRRKSGAKVEVFLLKPSEIATEEAMQAHGTLTWEAMVGNRKRWAEDESLLLDGPVPARFFWVNKNLNLVGVELTNPKHRFKDLVNQAGKMPLPPYLNREAVDSDKEDYQTVYSKEEGSVAAPTAGLHFTDEVIAQLKDKGIRMQSLVLHVGAGTFQPVTTENAKEHHMHNESFRVEAEVLQTLATHQGPIIPVGTTALRTLESMFWAAQLNSTSIPSHAPYEQKIRFASRQDAMLHLLQKYPSGITGDTSIYIYPGYKTQMADAIITNFHQPGSTLMLLIAALVGDAWKNIYQEALNNSYRFLSYGDASLLWRGE